MNCDSTIGYSENFAGLLSHLIIFWPCLRAGGGGGGSFYVAKDGMQI